MLNCFLSHPLLKDLPAVADLRLRLISAVLHLVLEEAGHRLFLGNSHSLQISALDTSYFLRTQYKEGESVLEHLVHRIDLALGTVVLCGRTCCHPTLCAGRNIHVRLDYTPGIRTCWLEAKRHTGVYNDIRQFSSLKQDL